MAQPTVWYRNWRFWLVAFVLYYVVSAMFLTNDSHRAQVYDWFGLTPPAASR